MALPMAPFSNSVAIMLLYIMLGGNYVIMLEVLYPKVSFKEKYAPRLEFRIIEALIMLPIKNLLLYISLYN